MNIPIALERRFAYHFTHFNNLDSIIDNGILSTNQKILRNISHLNVAEQGIQNRRSTMSVPYSNGRYIHDYVPLYFAKRTPMQLGVINKKNIDQPLILYFAVSIHIIESRAGVIFTDASANTDIPPKFYDRYNIIQLNTLNWDVIDSKKWGYQNEEIRHQKMAELLIPDMIYLSDISYIVVWNKIIKEEVEKIFNHKGIKCPDIRFDADHYYTNFYDNEKYSIVTGPIFLKNHVDTSINKIISQNNYTHTYNNIEEALNAIDLDFNSIKELADINGLKTDNPIHHDDVGLHTRKVVFNLVNSQEYMNLTEENKLILKLAAYFHDIGKGPKTRWPDGIQKVDNDHARKSLPMLERILTEEIGGLTRDSIRKIVTLVVYDDLIGDIVANGRNKEQLFELVTCKEDIDMLALLGIADMKAINPFWPIQYEYAINLLREEAIYRLQG